MEVFFLQINFSSFIPGTHLVKSVLIPPIYHWIYNYWPMRFLSYCNAHIIVSNGNKKIILIPLQPKTWQKSVSAFAQGARFETTVPKFMSDNLLKFLQFHPSWWTEREGGRLQPKCIWTTVGTPGLTPVEHVRWDIQWVTQSSEHKVTTVSGVLLIQPSQPSVTLEEQCEYKTTKMWHSKAGGGGLFFW